MPAIFLAIFVDVLGFSIILPGLPYVVLDMGGTTETGTAMMAVFSLAAFIFSPIWGRLSDRIGRKTCLAMTFVGASASYILLVFADTIMMLFLARFLAGAMAGNIAIAMASIADTTTPDQRGRMMGMFGAVFGVAFSIGPGIGGFVSGSAEHPSLMIPGLIAASLAAFAVFITLFFFNPRRRTEAEKERARERIPLRSVVPDRRMVLLLIQFCMAAGIQAIIFPLTPFWCKEVLGWDQQQVGWLMVAIGGIILVGQGLVVPYLFKRIGEIKALLGGFIVASIAGILMALVPDAEWKAWVLLPLVSGGATVAFPALNSTLSRRSEEHTQGTALGLGNGLAFLGRIAGPVTGGALFEMYSPDTPYLVVTLLGVVAIVWAASEIAKGEPPDAHDPDETIPAMETRGGI